MTQQELAEALGVEQRSIRNHVARGMPVESETPRPLYRFGHCWVWHAYLTWQTAEYQRNRHFQPLQRFSYQTALSWWLPRQHAERPQDGNDFVVVPLRRDHPRRADQLQVAREGLQPLVHDEGDEADDDDAMASED
jgi:hypothetical protein